MSARQRQYSRFEHAVLEVGEGIRQALDRLPEELRTVMMALPVYADNRCALDKVRDILREDWPTDVPTETIMARIARDVPDAPGWTRESKRVAVEACKLGLKRTDAHGLQRRGPRGKVVVPVEAPDHFVDVTTKAEGGDWATEIAELSSALMACREDRAKAEEAVEAQKAILEQCQRDLAAAHNQIGAGALSLKRISATRDEDAEKLSCTVARQAEQITQLRDQVSRLTSAATQARGTVRGGAFTADKLSDGVRRISDLALPLIDRGFDDPGVCSRVNNHLPPDMWLKPWMVELIRVFTGRAGDE